MSAPDPGGISPSGQEGIRRCRHHPDRPARANIIITPQRRRPAAAARLHPTFTGLRRFCSRSPSETDDHGCWLLLFLAFYGGHRRRVHRDRDDRREYAGNGRWLFSVTDRWLRGLAAPSIIWSHVHHVYQRGRAGGLARGNFSGMLPAHHPGLRGAD